MPSDLMRFQNRVTASRRRILKESAQRLRREQTPAEQTLWARLRGDQLGVRFRRQHCIGDFIVDFYCAERRVVVEIDGRSHDNLLQADRDGKRDAVLVQRGLRILRFANAEVLIDVDRVVHQIRIAIGLTLG